MPVRRQVGQQTYTEICNLITEAVQQVGYAPLTGVIAGGGNISNIAYPGSGVAWAGGKPDWFPGIRRYMFRRGEPHNIDGTILIQCESCGLFHTVSGLQIDHNGGWQNMIEQGREGPITNLEARILYNNIYGLQLYCSFCNGRHPENFGPAQGARQARTRHVQQCIEQLIS